MAIALFLSFTFAAPTLVKDLDTRNHPLKVEGSVFAGPDGAVYAGAFNRLWSRTGDVSAWKQKADGSFDRASEVTGDLQGWVSFGDMALLGTSDDLYTLAADGTITPLCAELDDEVCRGSTPKVR